MREPLAAGTFAALALASAAAGDGPPRLVSLDYCADQYVLALADRAQIVAVSRGADDDYAFLREEAAGLRQVRASAEDVLALEPDLVVSHFGATPRARSFFERVDIPVHQIGYVNDFDGVAANVRAAGDAFGQAERAGVLAADLRARLAALQAVAPPREDRPRALYVTPGGATAGSGTMVHAIMEAGGLANIAAEDAAGWRPLPLEALVMAPPDLVVTSFFNINSERLNRWSAARHPAMTAVLDRTPRIDLPGAITACPAWFMVDAAEAIAAGVAELSQ